MDNYVEVLLHSGLQIQNLYACTVLFSQLLYFQHYLMPFTIYFVTQSMMAKEDYHKGVQIAN